MSSSELQHDGEVVKHADADGKVKRGFFGRIILFIQQVIAELKKVVTPTRSELINYTIVVIAFVLVMMAIVWVLDQVFGWLTLFIFGTPLV